MKPFFLFCLAMVSLFGQNQTSRTLTNVNVVNPTNGQCVVYNGTTKQWTNSICSNPITNINQITTRQYIDLQSRPSVNTIGPLSGGGALDTSLTLSCPTCAIKSGETYTGYQNFTGASLSFPLAPAFTNLPSAGSNTNKVYVINDGNSTCTAGGGTNRCLVTSDGVSWKPYYSSPSVSSLTDIPTRLYSDLQSKPSVNTTGPLTGGGALATSLTLDCPNCALKNGDTYSGYQNFSGATLSFPLAPSFSNLPVASGNTNKVYVITDGNSTCTAGGGSNRCLVTSNGTSWNPYYVFQPSVTWGSITGTLSSQSDLNTALAGKEPANANIQAHISNLANPHNVTANQVLPTQTGQSGNVLSTDGSNPSWVAPSPKIIDRTAAVCQNGIAGTGFFLPSAAGTFPNPVCPSGTPNLLVSTLQFTDASVQSIQDSFYVSSCTGLQATLSWSTIDTTTTNNVMWALKTSYLTTGDTRATKTWNTQQTVTANPTTTTNGQIDTTIVFDANSLTGCAVGKRVWVQIDRLATTDTSTQTVDLMFVQWSMSK